MSRRSLGRGLSALIPGRLETAEYKVIQIGVEEIDPNPYQPRENFDLEGLQELSNSIRENGLIQPVVVRKNGDRYQLVAGERRLRAAKLAGMREIPAIVKDIDDVGCGIIALAENLIREDLNALEQAQAIKTIIDKFGLKQEEVATKLGVSRSFVTNQLRLLSLPEQIQDMIMSNKISRGHAMAILSLENEELQIKLAETIVRNSLSVRETEKLARLMCSAKKTKRAKASKERLFDRVSKGIEDALGIKPHFKIKKRGFEVSFKFKDLKELENFVEKLELQNSGK